jgi:hypothetical protein
MLGLLAAALLLKGLVWSMTLPPFDAPDEPSHFVYAQLLALRGQLPVSSRALDAGPDVVALTNDVAVPSVPPGAPSARFYPDRLGPGVDGSGEAQATALAAAPGRGNPAAEYGPVTYAMYAVPIRLAAGAGIVAEVAAARLVAVLMGVAAGIAVVWLARECGLDRRLALTAAAVVGLEPMWSQQTAVVSADPGVLLFGTLFLAALLAWRRTARAPYAAVAACFMLLGLFSKPAMVFALPLPALPALIRPSVPVPRPRRTAVSAGGLVESVSRPRRIAIAAGCIAASAMPFGLWTLLRPGVAAAGSQHRSLSEYAQMAAAHHLSYYRGILAELWGQFGWVEVPLPSPVQLVLVGVTLLMLGLGALALLRAGSRSALMVATVYAALCLVSVVAFDVITWHNQGSTSLQGRYLLPALPVLVIGALAGGRALLGPRRGWLMVWVPVAGMLSLNLGALDLLWRRFYLG